MRMFEYKRGDRSSRPTIPAFLVDLAVGVSTALVVAIFLLRLGVPIAIAQGVGVVAGGALAVYTYIRRTLRSG